MYIPCIRPRKHSDASPYPPLYRVQPGAEQQYHLPSSSDDRSSRARRRRAAPLLTSNNANVYPYPPFQPSTPYRTTFVQAAKPKPRKPSTHQYRRPKHAFQTCPVDILAIIFHLGSQDSSDLAFLVARVCVHWRHVALQMPRLWSQLSLDRRFTMWQQCIHRTWNQPLHINLRVDGEGDNTHRARASPKLRDADDVSMALALVINRLRIWKSFSINFIRPSPYLCNAALSPLCRSRFSPPIEVPLLEALSLVYPDNEDGKVFDLFGGNAARLRKATIHSVRLKWDPLFSALTSLDYTHHRFSDGMDAVVEVLEMLMACRCLQVLAIGFFEANSEPLTLIQPHNEVHPFDTILELPFLYELRLRAHSREVPLALTLVMERLSLPALQILKLKSHLARHPLNPATTMTALASFQGNRSVRRLFIDSSWFDSTVVASIIGGLPRLRHLGLSGGHVSDKFLDGLTCVRRSNSMNCHPRRGSVRVTCPSLELIELHGCDRVSDQAIRRCMERRNGTVITGGPTGRICIRRRSTNYIQ